MVGVNLLCNWETPVEREMPEPIETISVQVINNEYTNKITLANYDYVFYYNVPLSADLQDFIRQECDYDTVLMEIVLGIIHTESEFNPNAYSGTNDYGLMQINKMNHNWLMSELGVKDFLDPYDNVKSGIHMFRMYLEMAKGDVELALTMYNKGETQALYLHSNGIKSSYSHIVLTNYLNYKENKIRLIVRR